MLPLPIRSIRARLVVSYVGLTLLTVGLMSALALALVERIASQRETRYLSSNASVIANKVAPLFIYATLQKEDQDSLATAAEMAALVGNVRVRILNQEREPLADSGPRPELDQFFTTFVSGQTGLMITKPLVEAADPRFVRAIPAKPDAPAPPPAPAEPAAMAGAKAMASDALRSGRVVAVPVTQEPGGVHVGYVEVSGGPDVVQGALATTHRALAVAGGVATLIAALAGLLVGRGLTSPLLGLTHTAARMEAGDLSARAEVRGSDETALLGRQFNHMAARLEHSFQQLASERDALRRFAADASHELRTPITALKTFNELLSAGADQEPATREEFLSESARQLERLERITRQLLDLSRLDAGIAVLQLQDEPVVELLWDAAWSHWHVATERQVRLELARPAPRLTVPCDRTRLECALSNLVANALRHTHAGGSIELGAERAGDRVRLWVRDSGAGIAPDDLPHVFERFYRGKSTVDAGGTGLGLAIVESVSRAHGGSVAVESALGRGSRFTIELPTAAPGVAAA